LERIHDDRTRDAGGFTLIQRLGYRLYPAGKPRFHDCPAWMVASMLWFVSRIHSFREFLTTAVNEYRALVDVLVASASHTNPPASVVYIQAMRPPSLSMSALAWMRSLRTRILSDQATLRQSGGADLQLVLEVRYWRHCAIPLQPSSHWSS